MKRRAASLWIFLLAFLPAAAAAPAPRFLHERTVTPAGSGPNRSNVDVALLAGAAPLRYAGGKLTGGLDDLRLYDASGGEVAYLLIAPATPSERWQDGTVLPVPATEETSGFELDLGKPLLIDRLRIRDLPPPFLKRMHLEGSGDRQRWTVLIDDGTLFDLPEERLQRTEVAFARSELRYLRVTWDDRQSAVVPPPRSAAARVVSPVSSREGVRVRVDIERRASEPGKSRFRLRLPGPRLPVIALELGCAGDHLLRPAQIMEPRLRGSEVVPVELGSSTLRRAVRGMLAAADLRIPIDRPEGPDLDLVVDDGDNPRLDLLFVQAELAPQPWIYFESADGQTLTARFGDPKLTAPRYDLEAMRESVVAPAAEALWGEVRGIQHVEEEPPTGDGIPSTGATLDVAGFRYRRAIAAGVPGLTAVVLDAAVLAHSYDLQDIRIADGGAHQVPYLVERRDEPLSLALPDLEPLPPPDKGPRTSRYRITLPYDKLPAARLVLSTTGRVFDRTVALSVERPATDARSKPRTERVASARWRHADTEQRAPDLVLALPSLGTEAAELTVDEGDNSPLPIERPRLLLPGYRLRFFRSGTEGLMLLYGQPALAAPRYDLALLAPRVLGETAHEVEAGEEIFERRASPQERGLTQARIFWVALGLAVAGLIAVIVRLLGKE